MQGLNQQDRQTHSSIPKHSTSHTAAIAVGISLPRNILGKIDEDRGDVSRSRFLLRIIERAYSSSYQHEEASSVKHCNEIHEADE
jgi:metal-responsive CopG/Arc/MetJ family transcriptional regulator